MNNGDKEVAFDEIRELLGVESWRLADCVVVAVRELLDLREMWEGEYGPLSVDDGPATVPKAQDFDTPL